MKILQTISVKQVLTETSRDKLRDQYLQNKLLLEKETGQLQFEQKKLEKTGKYQVSEVKSKFDKEIRQRAERIQELEFQLAQLDMLPLGSELKEKEVQAIIEVQPGDAWDNGNLKHEIIIRDGIIVEIR
ncbi:hypothetical protein AM500_15320 [Bacillus sp. FJAT-18017]|uniref:YlqD family protein n=1 Tax=Bacillus sp. FJAT-18017 TaxID=1705566 RepID=UPI0006AF0CC7|nr:YlqD family protein [Bacillus sp. FJAT-18017]ALC91003.1 hypothetical protein AM500_15320 [Bacillus sp. FJAT-18017]